MGQITKQSKADTMRQWLEKSIPTIKAVIPKHVTPDRLTKLVMTTIRNTPKLLDCDPRSVVNCFVGASELGLEIGGMSGQAHMVPFKKEATLIIGYKGLMNLARRSGEISVIDAETVYEKDTYEVEFGLEQKLKHKPARTDDRGAPVAAYAIARYKNGQNQFVWLWKCDVDKARPRHARGPDTPWETHWDEMAKKTAIRRLCKLLPASSELHRAIYADEAAERGESVEFVDLTPLGAKSPEPPATLDDFVPATQSPVSDEKTLQSVSVGPDESEVQTLTEDAPEPVARAVPPNKPDPALLKKSIRSHWDKLDPDRRKAWVKNVGLKILSAMETVDTSENEEDLRAWYDSIISA